MKWTVVFISLGLSACAHSPYQTKALLESPPPHLPRQAYVAGVPFVRQNTGQCGPATLAMTTAWAGRPIDIETLVREAYTPDKGTLQQDLITAARRHGFMAIKIEGLEPLLSELAGGHPVIVFENLGFSWLPQWHYAVATGYDLEEEEILLHSGSKASTSWGLKPFERSWAYSRYWGLVILPAGELAHSANEVAHLIAAAGLEQSGLANEAEISYQAILARWPKSLGALIGLANLAFKERDRQAAVEFLEMAVRYHPDSAAARHNLAVARGTQETRGI